MTDMSDSTPTPGVYINAKGKKTFIPLENNPAVFTDLVHRLGVSSSLGFYDVYSLDSPDLLSLIPRPVHALIFIAPAPVYYDVRRKHDGYADEKRITYNSSGKDEPMIWFRQTIGHACGLYSLIHAVGNGSAAQFIQPDSLLDKLLKAAVPLQRAERAEVLYNSKELEQAHMASAVKGDSRAPSSEEPVGYHFITFVKGKDGHLWELEGSWDPIDRGELKPDEDVLSEKAIEIGVGRYMKEASGNVELSIVALATRPEGESS
jgi:ubiquitin carboxyl-terminal hydrolase L3